MPLATKQWSWLSASPSSRARPPIGPLCFLKWFFNSGKMVIFCSMIFQWCFKDLFNDFKSLIQLAWCHWREKHTQKMGLPVEELRLELHPKESLVMQGLQISHMPKKQLNRALPKGFPRVIRRSSRCAKKSLHILETPWPWASDGIEMYI